MKENRFQERLRDRQVPLGHMILEFGVRSIAQLVAAADLDFVIIDTEHSAFTTSQLADLVAWFRATEVAPFVRIPQVEYHLIARTLDLGAMGIMVPNVKTAQQAKEIVSAAKYAPMGDRGVILGNANTGFSSVDPAEFLDIANERTTIICQIESVEGLNNVDAIASTPGVDVLWVGHFDMTQSMGIPGQFESQQFQDALQTVVETAQRHGLAAGIQPGSQDQAREWIQIGYNVISYSGDYQIYQAALVKGVNAIREITGQA